MILRLPFFSRKRLNLDRSLVPPEDMFKLYLRVKEEKTDAMTFVPKKCGLDIDWHKMSNC